MRKKTWQNILAMVLVLALLVSSIPTQVYALAGEALATALERSNEDPINEAMGVDRGVYEVTKLREESVKHFSLEDGTYMAVMYGSPVHTKDADGNWQDIDNRLSESGSEFSTSNARIKFAKKITGNEVLFTLHDGNRKITMSLDNAVKKTAGTVTNTVTDFDNEATQLQKLMTLDKLSSKILYENILDGVDLEYVVESLNVKENIIVKEKKDSYQYTFTIHLNNIEAVLREDGSVNIYDPDTNETVYNIPAGFMYDANGEYSTAVTYTLTATGNGKYSMTVTADAEWINAEDREFPVCIDPSVSVPTSWPFEYTSIHEWDKEATGNTLGFLAAGEYGIAYWKTLGLPHLPDGSVVTDAQFIVTSDPSNASYPNTCMTMELGVYKVLSDWDPEIFNYEEYERRGDGQFGATAHDTQVGADFKGRYTWDVGQIVIDWYNNPATNYGLAITSVSDVDGILDDSIFRFDANHEGNSLYIYYSAANREGMEDYWSYTTQSVRLAGNGYINNATGKLQFSLGTLSTTDSLFGFSPTLIWNQNDSGNRVNANFTPIMGYGFRINIQESITHNTYYDSNGNERPYYIWTDWDGTAHNFYPNDENNTVFSDDDGLQLTLTREDNLYVLTDRSHTKRIFSSPSQLAGMEDKNGNRLRFIYDSNSRVTAVDIIPNGYSAIRGLTFEYNSYGLLKAVKNTEAQQSVQFYYSPTRAISNASENSSGYLMRVRRTEQSTVAADCLYQYDSEGRLISAYDQTSYYRVEYTYNNGVVSSATEYKGSSSQQGQKVGLSYRENYAEVRSSGTDDIYGNDDDTICVYIFDDHGRVSSTYSTDASRTKIYGAAAGEYETQDNVKNNIKTSITVGGAASNYILNGGFEHGIAANWRAIGNVSSTSATSEIHDHYSASFDIIRNTSSGLVQSVFLPEGDYTLSVDVESKYTEDVTAHIFAESQSANGKSFGKEIPLDETSVVEGSITTCLNFKVENDNETGGETFLITLFVECGSHPNETAGSICFDNVMLERSIGHSGYSMVEFGNFEDYSGKYSYRSKWNTIWPVVNQGSLLGKALFVGAGTKNSEIVASQTIYTADSTNSSTSPKSFIISGMGKGTQQYASGDFGIELYIKYSSGSETVRLDFQYSSNEWQFVSKSYTTKKGYVRQVDVRLIYDNPGEAYFDNISVTQVQDDFTAKTQYYANGLVKNQGDSVYQENYVYDSRGNVTQMTNSYGEKYTYTYDDHDNVKTTKFFALDDANVLTLRSTTEYGYNRVGQLTSQHTYDGENLKGSANIISASYSYDLTNGSRTFGALLNETDNKGIRTKHFYDPLNGRLLASVNADAGTGTCYTYDGAGRTTSVRPATFSWETLSYTAVNNSALVEHSYNSVNQLKSISTTTTEYTFYYDGFGNAESVEIGGSEIISYDYNSNNGKLNTVTYANGFVVTYKYDELENLSEVWYNDGVSDQLAYKYHYTAYGSIYLFENHLVKNDEDEADIEYTQYSYDANNRLVSYTVYNDSDMANRFAVDYSYDADSRVDWIDYSFDYWKSFYGISNSRVSYDPTYDQDGTVTKYQVYATGSNGAINYVYDDFDRLTYKWYSFGGLNQFYSTVSYEYADSDGTNHTTALIETVTNTVMQNDSVKYTYEYNERNQITAIRLNTGVNYLYYYDDLGQLIREYNGARNLTYAYEYDNAGNIVRKTTYPSTSTSSPIDVKNYKYENTAWGDKLTYYSGYSFTYDEVGNPETYYNGNLWNFSWANGHQLIGATQGTGKSLAFTYNDEGIRVGKTVNGSEHKYYVDGARIIAEEWNHQIFVYLYDDNGQPIGFDYHNLLNGEHEFETFWFEKNLQGDIVAVYSSAGSLLVEYTYDAWGNCQESYTSANSTSAARKNPFRYRGYYYDVDLQMYYLQSRYYDPVIGRFISPDKFATTGQSVLGANMFAYCMNDPVNRIDIEGAVSLWYFLIIDSDMGYIHRKVQEQIKNSYSSVLAEVQLNSGMRADLVDPKTGEVWEVKHMGTNPLRRIFEAWAQAGRYLGQTSKSGVTLTEFGDVDEFEGVFTIACGQFTYLVEYATPVDGVVLYWVTEINYKPQYEYDYTYKPKENLLERWSTMTIPEVDYTPIYFGGMCCAAMLGLYAYSRLLLQ